MKKRFLCALLTLIMLVSLVPAAALTASAAGYSTSEAAITVLKQLEGYKKTCTNGYSGYGTLCTLTGDHADHEISEKQADAALRAALKELDTAVTSFAGSNGVSLSQSKHDALVLFSFENGTAWTTGTGDFKSAITGRLKGSEFLDAICRWDIRTADDSRRMVEANMYLNGVYSSAAPSSFIRINYDPSGRNTDGTSFTGSLNGAANLQYYDLTETSAIDMVPTMNYHKFLGWYRYDSNGNQVLVNKLEGKLNGTTLIARWQPSNAINGDDNTAVYYAVKKSALASKSAYSSPNGLELKIDLGDTIVADRDYIDSDNNKWLRISGTNTWVVLGAAGSYGSSSSSSEHTAYIDVTVTVTNSYVRSRVNETVYSAQNGTYYQGDKLRIINTAQGDGFLWGQVAKSATDNTPIGWVALMYTNWESVKDSGSPVVNNGNTIATAVIKVAANNGYVNVRSDAGTNYKIVGAIANGTTVNLYETKFVNGHEWGRCSSGWFCLTYAEVTRLTDKNTSANDTGLLSYVFSGTLQNLNIYTEPSLTSDMYITRQMIDSDVTISHLKADSNGNTWGKIPQGWVLVSDAAGNMKDVKLDVAKYYVTADSLTVRSIPSNDGQRVDTLNKGVEFNVNGTYQIVVVGETIWGYADKVGENDPSYNGWVNLAGTNVSRNGLPTLKDEEHSASISGKMATIVNTDNVNVREYTDATYAKVGSLSRGTTVAVWEEEDGWYKIDSNKNGKYDYEEDGWVSAKYLNIFDAESSSSSTTGTTNGGNASGSVETGLGVVANSYTGVNVRTGAGIGYPTNGKILTGTTVEILEVKPVGASKWGRVTQGWICMDYVTMISNYTIAGSTSSTGSTGSSTSTNTTASESAVFTGKITAASVTVYKTTSLQSDAVRTLTAGDPVTVHELMVVEETVTEATNPETNEGNTTTVTTTRSNWARINDGYIYSPGDNLTLDTLDEITYTVTSYEDTADEYLNVYDGVKGSVKAAEDLEKYDTVSVTTLRIEEGNVWCRVEYTDEDGFNHDGYVKMKYLTRGVVAKPVENNNNNNNTNTNTNTGNGTTGNIILGSSGNTANQGTNGYVNNAGGYRYTGKVIRTGSVNVRALPSQTAPLTTTLKSGAALVIYETTISEGMAWGRCDAGWVYLYYVDLQPCNTAVDAKVVYNENTIAYEEASTSSTPTGTYSRMSVVDIYEVVGNMCKTDLGWVHVDNLG